MTERIVRVAYEVGETSQVNRRLSPQSNRRRLFLRRLPVHQLPDRLILRLDGFRPSARGFERNVVRLRKACAVHYGQRGEGRQCSNVSRRPSNLAAATG